MKIVCFDFDGTLADSFKFLQYSFDKVFYKHLGIHMTPQLFDKLSGPNEKGFLMKEFEDKYEDKYWEEYLSIYKEDANKMITMFPGMKDMLINLKNKGVHLVFLTGRSMETAMISLNDFGIADVFEGYYAGSIEGCVKDKLLKDVANDFKIETSDILYVGDSRQDIKDAKKAGSSIVSVLFSNPAWWEDIKKENPNYVFDTKELEKRILIFLSK